MVRPAAAVAAADLMHIRIAADPLPLAAPAGRRMAVRADNWSMRLGPARGEGGRGIGSRRTSRWSREPGGSIPANLNAPDSDGEHRFPAVL